MSARRLAIGAALLLSAALLVAWPLHDLVANGPFAWHFAQPTAIEGGIELVAFAVLLYGALSLPGARWRMAVAIVLVAAYLRRHHADAAAASSLFLLELLVAAGAAAMRALRAVPRNVDGDHYLRCFVLGLGVVAAIFLASSVLGNGRARDLRGLAVICALPIFAYARQRPLSWHVLRRLVAVEPGLRAIGAVLVAWLAATWARTGNVLGYDSPWYGLRGDIVLAPVRSLFDETGLVSPVYYYPKLYELLLLPLNGLGTYVHAMALATAMLVVLALACWRFARALGATEREAGWAVLLVVSLPVVANHGVTTKSELLAVALLVIAARFVLAFADARSRGDALVAVAALLLAVQAKLTTGPFVAVVALVLGVVAWRARRAPPAAMPPARTGWIALALAVAVSAVLTSRTLLLAGVPTIGPDPLLRLWLALGFTLREPVGSLSWIRPQDWGDLPALVLDLLVRPSALSHVIVTWTGNAWLWCLVVALLAGGTPRALAKRPVAAWLLALCGACGLWLALGQRYFERGGDGNYFMLAPILALLAGVPLVLRRARHAAVPVALAAFAAMQFAYAFVSMGWGTPGTHAWDLDFTRGADRAAVLRHGMWEYSGMLELAGALAHEPRTLRLVGDLPEVEGFLLPVRFEPLAHLYGSYPERFASPAALAALLDAAGVEALVVPTQGTEDRARILPAVAELTRRWREDPAVRRVPAGRYELLVRDRAH